MEEISRAVEIRVSRGIQVTVNNEGETITVNVDDQNLVEKFYGMTDRLEALSGELRSESVKQMGDRERLQLVIDRTKAVMEEIDATFGAGACRKIFGDIVPTHYLIADFFDQLKPVINKCVAVRKKAIEKRYNNRRKGSRGEGR